MLANICEHWHICKHKLEENKTDRRKLGSPRSLPIATVADQRLHAHCAACICIMQRMIAPAIVPIPSLDPLPRLPLDSIQGHICEQYIVASSFSKALYSAGFSPGLTNGLCSDNIYEGSHRHEVGQRSGSWRCSSERAGTRAAAAADSFPTRA